MSEVLLAELHLHLLLLEALLLVPAIPCQVAGPAALEAGCLLLLLLRLLSRLVCASQVVCGVL